MLNISTANDSTFTVGLVRAELWVSLSIMMGTLANLEGTWRGGGEGVAMLLASAVDCHIGSEYAAPSALSCDASTHRPSHLFQPSI